MPLDTTMIPRFLCSATPRARGPFTARADDADISPPGYIDDAWLDSLQCLPMEHARTWLREELPKVWERLSAQAPVYPMTCKEVDGRLVMSFATGGWSGAEDITSRIMRHVLLRTYVDSVTSGGRFTVSVPAC